MPQHHSVLQACLGVGVLGWISPVVWLLNLILLNSWVFPVAKGYYLQKIMGGHWTFPIPQTLQVCCKDSSGASRVLPLTCPEKGHRKGLTMKEFLSFQSLGCFEDPNTDRRSFHSFLNILLVYSRVSNQLHFTFQKIYK